MIPNDDPHEEFANHYSDDQPPMIPNDDPPEQFANHYSDDNSSIVHLFIL